jgi:predicted SAM-dependent methyltransferase
MSDVPESMRSGRDDVANRYIAGHGIEIGAGNSPIRFAANVDVKYVDFATKEVLVNVHGFAEDWTAPDIIDDGEKLLSIADGSLDFVIACHVLEHTQNPLRVMQTWFSKIRSGGVVFIAIPDRRFCFDKDRPLTPFEHLLSDYENGPELSEDAHLHEWTTLVDRVTDQERIEYQIRELKRIDYRIHYHVWETTSFIEAVARSNGIVGDFDIEHCGFNYMEALAVLRKR